MRMNLRVRAIVAAGLAVWLRTGLAAAVADPFAAGADSMPVEVVPVTPVPVSVPFNEERIFKVIPDYQTVQASSQPVAPLTAAQKWNLGWKEAGDPFNIASAAMTAAFSQRDNQTPSYGEGWKNYGKRFGAAVADFGTQSLLSSSVFAVLLKQDPRYFRKGPGSGVLPRVLYSVSRVLICRNDAGRPVFNSSNFLGMGVGIAASNLYYPAASRTAAVMAGRIETSLFGGITGNLMSEFWPDVQRKLFRKKAGK